MLKSTSACVLLTLREIATSDLYRPDDGVNEFFRRVHFCMPSDPKRFWEELIDRILDLEGVLNVERGRDLLQVHHYDPKMENEDLQESIVRIHLLSMQVLIMTKNCPMGYQPNRDILSTHPIFILIEDFLIEKGIVEESEEVDARYWFERLLVRWAADTIQGDSTLRFIDKDQNLLYKVDVEPGQFRGARIVATPIDEHRDMGEPDPFLLHSLHRDMSMRLMTIYTLENKAYSYLRDHSKKEFFREVQTAAAWVQEEEKQKWMSLNGKNFRIQPAGDGWYTIQNAFQEIPVTIMSSKGEIKVLNEKNRLQETLGYPQYMALASLVVSYKERKTRLEEKKESLWPHDPIFERSSIQSAIYHHATPYRVIEALEYIAYQEEGVKPFALEKLVHRLRAMGHSCIYDSRQKMLRFSYNHYGKNQSEKRRRVRETELGIRLEKGIPMRNRVVALYGNDEAMLLLPETLFYFSMYRYLVHVLGESFTTSPFKKPFTHMLPFIEKFGVGAEGFMEYKDTDIEELLKNFFNRTEEMCFSHFVVRHRDGKRQFLIATSEDEKELIDLATMDESHHALVGATRTSILLRVYEALMAYIAIEVKKIIPLFTRKAFWLKQTCEAIFESTRRKPQQTAGEFTVVRIIDEQRKRFTVRHLSGYLEIELWKDEDPKVYEVVADGFDRARRFDAKESLTITRILYEALKELEEEDDQ